MKPLTLKMHNIGPFKDETLDFSSLDGMFIIYGNTGAGKTSIFDAMTYALYGVLNGSRKGNIRAFRSDFAVQTESSSVEFTFEIARTKYRVYRTLPQQYVKRNGTIGDKPVIVSLESCSGTDVFTTVNGSTNETNERIEKIIGLNAADFSRIVLLPQGAFAEFLHESSKDRRDTLSKLFPVDSYSAIIDEVKSAADENAKLLEAIAAQTAGNAEKYNAETAEKDLDGLRSEMQKFENQQKELMNKVAALSAEKEKISAKFASAVQNENNRKKLEDLLTQTESINSSKRKITLSGEAAKLAEYIHSMQQCENTRKKCTQDVHDAQSYALQVKQKLEELTSQQKKYEEIKKNAEEAESSLPQLRERLVQIKQLQILQKKAEQLAAAKKIAEDKLTALTALSDGTFSDFLSTAEPVCTGTYSIQENMPVTRIISILASAEQDAKDKKNNAQTVVKNAGIRAALEKEISESEVLLSQSAAAYEQAKQHAANLKKCIEDLQRRIELQKQNNAAYFLVASLEEGQPCPVCGSRSHPAPVMPLPESLDLQTKIETAQHSLELAQIETDKKLQQNAGAEKQLEEKKKQLAEAEPAPSLNDALKGLAEADTAYQTISRTVAKASAYANQYQEEQHKLQQLMLQSGTIKTDAASAQAAYMQLAETVSNKPEKEQPDPDSLAAEIALLEKTAAEGKAAYKKWSDSYTDACTKDASAAARLEELVKQLQSAKEKEKTAAQTLSQHLSGSPFGTEEEAESAFLPDDDRSVLEKSVTEYEDEVKKLTALINNAEQTESSGILHKQIELKESESEETQKELGETGKSIRDISSRYNALNSYIKENISLEKQRSELEKKSAPYKMLYADLSGKNPKNIPFDAWALGMYFEQIVQYANTRFNDISNGRYMFKIAEDRQTGSGYKGLDLLVSDSFTGMDRDTATLSGGETFMASISLALALTDIIQNRNGGVRLDSLFIDEGFGTLDEETLDCAISILANLQETKMVGIISHVESMRSAVRSQVEIIKTAEGSHIKIQ
jgi:DNA repair protein SbcC/Rad50